VIHMMKEGVPRWTIMTDLNHLTRRTQSVSCEESDNDTTLAGRPICIIYHTITLTSNISPTRSLIRSPDGTNMASTQSHSSLRHNNTTHIYVAITYTSIL